MPRFLASLILAFAVLLPSHHTSWSDSIKPLAWTTDITDRRGEGVIGQTVKNHCTAWAYQKPNNPYETHWITAAHCVIQDEDDPTQAELSNHDFQIDGHACYVENFEWPTDIASLHCEGLEAPGLPLAAYEPEVTQPVVLRGYPLGYSSLFTTKGYVVVLHWHDEGDPEDVFYNIYSVPTAPSNSGSPVFDDNDHVIGLLQIGWGKSFSPVGGGLDIEQIRLFVNTLPD